MRFWFVLLFGAVICSVAADQEGLGGAEMTLLSPNTTFESCVHGRWSCTSSRAPQRSDRDCICYCRWSYSGTACDELFENSAYWYWRIYIAFTVCAMGLCLIFDSLFVITIVILERGNRLTVKHVIFALMWGFGVSRIVAIVLDAFHLQDVAAFVFEFGTAMIFAIYGCVLFFWRRGAKTLAVVHESHTFRLSCWSFVLILSIYVLFLTGVSYASLSVWYFHQAWFWVASLLFYSFLMSVQSLNMLASVVVGYPFIRKLGFKFPSSIPRLLGMQPARTHVEGASDLESRMIYVSDILLRRSIIAIVLFWVIWGGSLLIVFIEVSFIDSGRQPGAILIFECVIRGLEVSGLMILFYYFRRVGGSRRNSPAQTFPGDSLQGPDGEEMVDREMMFTTVLGSDEEFTTDSEADVMSEGPASSRKKKAADVDFDPSHNAVSPSIQSDDERRRKGTDIDSFVENTDLGWSALAPDPFATPNKRGDAEQLVVLVGSSPYSFAQMGTQDSDEDVLSSMTSLDDVDDV